MAAHIALFAGLLVASHCLPAVALSYDAPRDTAVRNLVAAAKPSHQKSRSYGIEFSRSADLVYADRSSYNADKFFAAKVSVTSERPILVLEDFEHLFDHVACGSDTITLFQHPSGSMWRRDDFEDLVHGHIITSHYGCNKQHARQPYEVLAITSASHDAVTFDIAPASLRDSFDTFKIEMGYIDDVHEARPHSPTRQRHWARQATPTAATGVQSAVPFNGSTIPNVVDPAPAPSSTALAYDFDLAGSLIDKSLGPFDTPAGTVPVEIGCVNCTTFGVIDVTFASFEWTCSSMESAMENPESCLQGGAEITTQGLGAHMEMSANLSDSFSFQVPLDQLQAKFSISIPDIGSASVVFGNVLAGGYDMEGNVGMTYGFDLAVPDGSKILLDVLDLEASSISGFQNAAVTAIPIQTSVEIQKLNMYLALRAIIKASFDFEEHFDMEGDFGAGVYVDLPILSASITPVTNVDENCRPLSAAAMSSTPGLNVTSAISVGFSAGVDFGAFVKAEATFFDQSFADDNHNVNFNASIPIGAGCFDFKNNSASTVGAAGTVGSTDSHKSNSASPLLVWQAAPLSVALFFISSIFLTL